METVLGAAAEKDEVLLDLDAFQPQPTKFLSFKGHRYAVRAFLDLTIPEVLEVMRIERDIASMKDYVEQMSRCRKQVEILAPKLDAGWCECHPKEIPIESPRLLDKLTGHQLLKVALLAMKVGEIPQMPNLEESGLDTGSPRLGDSTGGPGQTSAA